MILNLTVSLAAVISIIMTIFLSAVVYNAFFNRIIFNKLTKLKILKRKREDQVSKISIDFIKMIYEKNKKPSMTRIFFISFIINFVYFLIMYTNIPKHPMISEDLYILGICFFIMFGTIIMTVFEYYAYKINIQIINNFDNNKSYWRLLFSLLYKLFIFIVTSIIIGMIFYSTNNQAQIGSIHKIVEFIIVFVVYFSPFGSLMFIFDTFGTHLNNISKYLLIIPTLSIFAPIIFFISMNILYKKSSLLIKIIENIDSFARYCHRKDIDFSQEKFDKIIVGIICFSLFVAIFT